MSVEVIVNRCARRLDEGSPLRRELLAAAAAHGARVHETRSLTDLHRVAGELAAAAPSAVVLAGGDGSYMEGLSALARAFPAGMPPVAFAPGGTVGTVARGLGLRSEARAWCRDAVRVASEGGRGGRRQTPTLRVRDDAGGDRVGFIFGAGLVARFFEVYDASPRQGLAPAAAIAGRVLLGSITGGALARRVLSPVGGRLEVDGAPVAGAAWSLVLASVLQHVGLGVRATYRAGQPGSFHVVASGLPARGLAAQVPRVLTGRPMHGADHVDALARSLRMTLDEPGGYILDGDAHRARVVRIEAGPAVTVLVP